LTVFRKSNEALKRGRSLGLTDRKKGTERTRRFYDEKGWALQSGDTVDRNLFGVKEDGPIRIELHRLHLTRLRAALSSAGSGLNLLECGCGGQPEKDILDLCSRYTGVDFSEAGLRLAKSSLTGATPIPIEFMKADACALPFGDGTFDAVYSAHMIYHIDDMRAQEIALSELMRVVRPSGIVAIITANPRPLLFPVRFVKRAAMDAPVVGRIINRIRPNPPLPYRPMTIGWMRTILEKSGKVRTATDSIPSSHFSQHVTEYRGIGKQIWRAIRWLTINRPVLSAYLGNYVMIVCHKHPLAEP
jgi:ubiquinone/menaquinone biosynthesis C-methylase UbiE